MSKTLEEYTASFEYLRTRKAYFKERAEENNAIVNLIELLEINGFEKLFEKAKTTQEPAQPPREESDEVKFEIVGNFTTTSAQQRKGKSSKGKNTVRSNNQVSGNEKGEGMVTRSKKRKTVKTKDKENSKKSKLAETKENDNGNSKKGK